MRHLGDGEEDSGLCVGQPVQEGYRHLLRQPHPIIRLKEGKAVGVHGIGVDAENHRLAIAAPDLGRGSQVLGKVYVMPLPGAQALGKDRCEKPRGRAVVKHRRGNPGFIGNGYRLGGMPLHGADALAVVGQGKALFIVACHHGLDQRAVELLSGRCGAVDQGIEIGPAFAVQSQADGLGFVAEHVAEELAGAGMVVAHGRVTGLVSIGAG